MSIDPTAAADDTRRAVEVVLPGLDEALALPWALSRMPAAYRPIVVDNGLTDGSAEIAADHGAVVPHTPVRGFGAARHVGVMAAASPVVAVMDADASLDARDPAAGWRVCEVPVLYCPRTGRSRVTGTVAGTVRAVRDMRRVLAS